MRCEFICEVELSEVDANDYRWFIDHNYRRELEIDNLPAVENNTYEKTLQFGYPVGYKEAGGYYLYNHVDFVIQVHPI